MGTGTGKGQGGDHVRPFPIWLPDSKWLRLEAEARERQTTPTQIVAELVDIWLADQAAMRRECDKP